MKHSGSALRREMQGYWELDVPPYEHQPLDDDVQEQRFLILHPCPGNKKAAGNHVRCSIEVRPLATAGPFIAVKDSRGYRLVQDAIEIDGKGLVIPAAVEVFLRHFRGHHAPVTLWIRHICLLEFGPNAEKRYWTRGFLDSMYARATQVVSMTEFVTDLVERGIVERRTDSRYSAWNKTWHYLDDKPRDFTLPTVYPIKLGKALPSNERPVTKHDYVPLDMLVGEIRVIVVVPAENDDAPIVAHLAHCPLVCEVVYHALSYVWGDPDPAVEIVVNGQKMRVRKNLEQALRTIRQSERAIAIWVDAVCIDQSNIVERNRQISRMFDIYDRATQVVCYVGEHNDDTNLALGFVPYLDTLGIMMNDKGHYDIGKEGDKIGPEKYPRLCAALYKFMCRPYFRRIWVIQEVAISSDPAVFVDNRKDVAFGSLDAAAYNLQAMIASNPDLTNQIMRADPELEVLGVSHDEIGFIRKLFYFRHLMAGGAAYQQFFPPNVSKHSPGFLEAAILARDFQATDGRDKLFALWNLAQDKKDLDFQLDYTKSLEKVFLDFATAWATQHGSLDVITASEPHRNAKGFYDSVPSWCPDWTTPTDTSCLVRREKIPMRAMMRMDDLDGQLYFSDGGIAQPRNTDEFFRFDGSVLKCRGIILDRIGQVFDDPGEPPASSHFYSMDRDIYRFQEWCVAVQKFYETRETNPYGDPLQAVIAMLHGDVSSAWNREGYEVDEIHGHSRPFNDGKEQDAWRHYDCIGNNSRHVPIIRLPFGYEQHPWFDIIQSVLRGRSLCITEKGYMALLPTHVTDDISGRPWVLAVLATCSVPVLLQQLSTSENGEITYRFGGTCFVQGWMEGEMLMKSGSTQTPGEFWFTEEASTSILRIA
ncbi:hypothetical protein EsH8_IV_000354 [Colletotrichum jinshuiense]